MDISKKALKGFGELVAKFSEYMEESGDPPVPLFIALSGKKQTGKDTSCKIVRDILESKGYIVDTIAFADGIKNICGDYLGVDKSLLNGTDAEKETFTKYQWNSLPEHVRLKYAIEAGELRSGNMTVRDLMQIVGTEIFREMFNYDIWAEAPFQKKYDADVVLITDCRFPNERDCTVGNGGVIIRIERDTGLEDNHPSEIALDGYQFDYTYQNNGSLEELESFLRKTLQEIGLFDD